MRKIKTILGIVFSLAIVTTMNTTVFAANDSGIPERRGVYIRECVGYEPNYTNIDYTHKLFQAIILKAQVLCKLHINMNKAEQPPHLLRVMPMAQQKQMLFLQKCRRK